MKSISLHGVSRTYNVQFWSCTSYVGLHFLIFYIKYWKLNVWLFIFLVLCCMGTIFFFTSLTQVVYCIYVLCFFFLHKQSRTYHVLLTFLKINTSRTCYIRLTLKSYPHLPYLNQIISMWCILNQRQVKFVSIFILIVVKCCNL